MAENKALCALCGQHLQHKWDIFSASLQKDYSLYGCPACGLWQLWPVPADSELAFLYEENYFGQRTDRGYDDYTSEAVQSSVVSTLQKNLEDLGFFSWEKELVSGGQKPAVLDIGAAAGHSVGYFAGRGWNSQGIDVSASMVKAAQKRKLQVVQGDFLLQDYQPASFDLVTLWATLEHLPAPWLFLQKAASLLKPGGRLYLSTCHTGFFARLRGKYWRYLNVPEHIWYFNRRSLALWGQKTGLLAGHSFTYGSGWAARKNAGWVYRFGKKSADFWAKKWHSGDMIVLEYQRAKAAR